MDQRRWTINIIIFITILITLIIILPLFLIIIHRIVFMKYALDPIFRYLSILIAVCFHIYQLKYCYSCIFITSESRRFFPPFAIISPAFDNSIFDHYTAHYHYLYPGFYGYPVYQYCIPKGSTLLFENNWKILEQFSIGFSTISPYCSF